MDKVCDYCDCQYDDSLDNCPHCGAANDYVRRADGTPRTIEELRKWYADRNLPSEDITRFYIGKDYRGAQAFGIYKDANGDFVVYKNKSDGSRAVRYQGGDESYAVNEIYCKLKEYIAQNKANNSGNIHSPAGNINRGSRNKGKKPSKKTVIILIILAIILLSFFFGDGGSRSGYSGGYFGSGYSYGDYGYDYDDYGDYDSGDSWDDDWDSDYDWDSGDSWDIGGDWDSDW